MASAGCVGGASCDTTQDSSGQKVVCTGSIFTYTLQGSRTGETDTYSWKNSDNAAYVNAVFQGTGTIYVTIKDHEGTQVYAKEHRGAGQTAGSQRTSDGVAGTWTIRIETRSLNGQVALEVNPDPR